MPPTAPTKAETLTAIHTSRQALEQAIGRLSAAQLITPGSVTELWSGKDLMAHIASWEQAFLSRLQVILQGETAPPVLLHGEDWPTAIQRHNDAAYLAYKDYGLVELQNVFADSHEQLVIAIRDLNEDQLSATSPLNVLLGMPVWGLLRGVSYHHYDFHATDLQKYLAR